MYSRHFRRPNRIPSLGLNTTLEMKALFPSPVLGYSELETPWNSLPVMKKTGPPRLAQTTPPLTIIPTLTW